MLGPGAYVPDRPKGIVDIQDLPRPPLVAYSRNHDHTPCPRCGHRAYRHKSGQRRIGSIKALLAPPPCPRTSQRPPLAATPCPRRWWRTQRAAAAPRERPVARWSAGERGLLEHVHEAPTHYVDIYKLATELKVHLDALLRLTETAELLGFATVAQGDITLTPLGETFAEASILARKEIFATRIRRLPMFKWLLAMLRAADKHQLEKDVISTALELDFTPDEAIHQVEVAINWGRYAELLAYDDTSETLYLETGSAPPTMAC